MAASAIGRSRAPANTVPSVISRRAALATFAIAPITCAVPAIAASTTAAWDDLYARWRRAKSEGIAHDRRHLDPMFKEMRQVWGDTHIYPDDANFPAFDQWRNEHGYHAACEESERLTDIQCDLEREMMELPAPHHAALLWKMDQLWGPEACDPDGYSPSWSPEYFRPFLDDVKRLVGAA